MASRASRWIAGSARCPRRTRTSIAWCLRASGNNLAMTDRTVGWFAVCAMLMAIAQSLDWAPAGAQERLSIVAATGDLRTLADAVGGDRVAVTSLVPPGFDAEAYQPR